METACSIAHFFSDRVPEEKCENRKRHHVGYVVTAEFPFLKRNARYLRHFCVPHKKNLSRFFGIITSFLVFGTQASNKLHAMAQERFRINFAFLTHLPSIMFPGSRTKTRTTSRLCCWLLPRVMLRRSASCWQQELTSSLRTRRIEQHSFGHRRKITEKSSRWCWRTPEEGCC